MHDRNDVLRNDVGGAQWRGAVVKLKLRTPANVSGKTNVSQTCTWTPLMPMTKHFIIRRLQMYGGVLEAATSLEGRPHRM